MYMCGVFCVCAHADKGGVSERDKWNALYLGVGECQGEYFKDSLLIKSDGRCSVWLFVRVSENKLLGSVNVKVQKNIASACV